MSYGFQEPDWPPVCECKYDEVHDQMDRGNCEIHCGTEEAPRREELPLEYQPEEPGTAVKKPSAIVERVKESAA